MQTDVVIIGGGIAGLWTRWLLESNGLGVLLIDRGPLGSGQTAASQGILHAGFKYALTEAAAQASAESARAAREWTRRLQGEDPPDLRSVRSLARSTHFWTTPDWFSRVAAGIGSRLVRSDIERLPPGQFPPAFGGAPHGVFVWQVEESVVDSLSAVETLSQAAIGPLRQGVVEQIDQSGRSVLVHIHNETGASEQLEAQAVVLAAGSGNADLLGEIGVNAAEVMQRRPLHQVLVRNVPHPLFGHCVQAKDRPRVTITTGTDDQNRWVWYVGGDVAESGVGRSRDQQIEAARQELRQCLPWVDLSRAEWATMWIDRAEGRTQDGRRPDRPTVRRFDRAVVAWPTKLVMAPICAQMVLDELGAAGTTPRVGVRADEHPGGRVSIAEPPWARKDLQWT